MATVLVLGDSVTWGQGLADQHKMSSVVAAAMGAQVEMLAHSGAVLGHDGQPCRGDAAFGEVPTACPNIQEQLGRVVTAPSDIPLVIVNGGINDIGVQTILNPFTSSADLATEIDHYCHVRMSALLDQVLAQFPAARVAVLTYYPILSTASHPLFIPFLMEVVGSSLPTFVQRLESINKVVQLSLQFWHQSDQALATAVAEANAAAGGSRAFIASAGFSEANAVFAPAAWLFGVSLDPLTGFKAEDEVIAERTPACNVTYAHDLLMREQCYRASVGHPTVTGAAKYAAAIRAVLGV